jgi:adenylate cyclase
MRRLGRYFYRYLHYFVPLPILIAAFFAWASDSDALSSFRLYVFDEFLRLKPRVYEPVPVRIVDIDDDSLARFGQWPWPRTLLAKLVNRLDELGVATIAFDILFIDADRTTPSHVIEDMPGIAPDDPVIARFASMPDHDQIFADAIKHSHVVLGFAPRGKKHTRLPEVKAGFAIAGDDPQPWIPHFLGAASSLAVLEAAAAGSGVLGMLPERDGIARRVPTPCGLHKAPAPTSSNRLARAG